MKILVLETSPYVRKVCIVADEKGLAYERVATNPRARPALLAKNNPMGKVPVLIDDRGRAIFDSNVIVDYLDAKGGEPFFIPTDMEERAEVKTVVSSADGIVDAVAAVAMAGFVDKGNISERWAGWQHGKAATALEWLEKRSKDGNYFCFGRLTLADVALVCALDFLDRVPSAQISWRDRCPRLLSSFEMLSQRDAFAKNLKPSN